MRQAKQVAGKRASFSTQIMRIGCFNLAERKVPASRLLFVVVLIGPPPLAAKIECIAAFRPQPVVNKSKSQLAVNGLQPCPAGPPVCWGMLAIKCNIGRNHPLGNRRKTVLGLIELVVDFTDPSKSG